MSTRRYPGRPILRCPTYREGIAKNGHNWRVWPESEGGILCSLDCLAEREGFYYLHFSQPSVNPTHSDSSQCLCGFQADSQLRVQFLWFPLLPAILANWYQSVSDELFSLHYRFLPLGFGLDARVTGQRVSTEALSRKWSPKVPSNKQRRRVWRKRVSNFP